MEENNVKQFCNEIYNKISDKSILGVTDEELYNIYIKIKNENKKVVEEKQEEVIKKENVVETKTEEIVDTTKEITKEDRKNIQELKPENVLKLNKSCLGALCKKYKLKVSGSKKVQVQRILNYANGSDEGSTKSPKKAKKSAKQVAEAVKNKPLFKKIQETISTIQIKRNKYNNFEHSDTGFVFDSLTKQVYGKQDGENVVNLTKDDIELCHKYHFQYRIPENLGTTKITKEDTEMLDEKILQEYNEVEKTTKEENLDETGQEITELS